jgi:anthranilate phosphoribosyltransferase
VLDKFIRQVQNSSHLTPEQVRSCVDHLVDERLPAESKADFLCHLALKGETVEEITWFAQAMREKAVAVPLDPKWRASHPILDVCGTGGDRLNTFNISTTVAIICAAAGIAVAKHGNRAVTSQSGSADVLEELGLRIDLQPPDAARSLQQLNFAFCFAPNYHPAFKHISAARKLCATRGQRTVFNFLGPLLNPAHPTAQLVGVPDPALCSPLAHVLQSLGVRRGMVVSGSIHGTGTQMNGPAHFDELSILGTNTAGEFFEGTPITLSALDVTSLPLQPATLADLAGGDRKANAKIVEDVLSGKERGARREAVLLNAAAALVVAGRANGLSQGWQLSAEIVDSGQAYAKVQALRGN